MCPPFFPDFPGGRTHHQEVPADNHGVDRYGHGVDYDFRRVDFFALRIVHCSHTVTLPAKQAVYFLHTVNCDVHRHDVHCPGVAGNSIKVACCGHGKDVSFIGLPHSCSRGDFYVHATSCPFTGVGSDAHPLRDEVPWISRYVIGIEGYSQRVFHGINGTGSYVHGVVRFCHFPDKEPCMLAAYRARYLMPSGRPELAMEHNNNIN